MHLITGGSGFLGSLIARELHKRGEKVRILDIVDDPVRSPDIEFIKADIRDRDSLRKAMNGIDVVHHNVALVPLTKSGSQFWDVNVRGSEIAAEEAARAKVKHFIHMSSSAIFGVPEKCPIVDSTPTNPIEIYGRGKLAGELAVQKICQQHNLPLIIIRPRTILGSGRLGIFQILFKWISESRKIYIIGQGNGGFQFIHAYDLMSAYMLAMQLGKPGIYNVGTDRFGTLREALTNLISYAHSSSKIVSLPEGPTIATLKFLDFTRLSPLAPWHYLTYHKPFHFDVSKLTQMGWKPKYSNDEMLAESYDWFLKNREQKEIAGESPHRKAVSEKILRLVRKFS